MYSIKKKAASLIIAGAMLFGGAFTGGNLNPFNIISFNPLSVSAATDATDEFTINGITYKFFNEGVSVTGCEAYTSVIIPPEVTYGGANYKVLEISGTAFKNNSVVSYIQIPEYVAYINPDTFIGCTNLSCIGVDMFNKYLCSHDGILYDKNVTELKKYPPKKTSPSYCVPNCVYNISAYAFNNCVYLERVYLTKNVLFISDGTFNGCSNLEEINVDSENSNLSSINGVLYSYDKKELIKYPGGLTNTSFTIINEVEKIYETAFIDAANLDTFNVDAGNYTFGTDYGVLFDFINNSLIAYPAGKPNTIYSVPSTVTNISNYAFTNSSITDIRNLDKRISLTDSRSNFVINSQIEKINDSYIITDENSSFIFSNIDKLERTCIIINAVRNKLEEAKKYLYDKYPNPTDYEKAKEMHDWLCNNIEYVPDTQSAYGVELIDSAGNKMPWNIPSQYVQDNYKYNYFINTGVTFDVGTNTYYVDDIASGKYHCASGALLMPFTVCEGYAFAYKLLLQSVGVKCEAISGINHAWNAVNIDGLYYEVDCTHDDNGNSGWGYSHFLKTNNNLIQNCYYFVNDQKVSSHSNRSIIPNEEINNLIFNVVGYPCDSISNEYLNNNSATSDYVM